MDSVKWLQKGNDKGNRPLKYDEKVPFVASSFRHLTELVAPIGPSRVAVPDPDPVFLHGSGSGFQLSLDLDPDPVFKFLWIRVRFQPIFWNKKKLQKGL